MRSVHSVLASLVAVAVIASGWTLVVAAEGGSLPPAPSAMPARPAPAPNPNSGPLMPAPVAVPAPAPVTAPAPVGPGNPLTPVGPGPESITRPVEEPKAGTTVVKITDKGFEPAKVTIKVGETVEWQNESKSPQSVSADPKLAKKKSSVKLPKGATSFSSGDIARGATFSHEFATAGSYKYVSLRNESVSGSITVKEAEAKKETRKATKTTPKNTTTKKTIAKKSSKKASKPAPEHDPNL